MKLKNGWTAEKYNAINEKALVNEVAYFIGVTKEIDDYIVNTLIQENDESGELDNYILFYMFCEYVVEFAHNSTDDRSTLEIIYDLRNNYKELVDNFKNKYFE